MWRGLAVLSISVSNYATNDTDVEASVASIIAAARNLTIPV